MYDFLNLIAFSISLLNHAFFSLLLSWLEIFFLCLRPSHTVPQCKYKRFCNISDCTTKHNGIVHVMINNSLKVRCLLDTGSTSSFVTKNLVSKLGIPRSQGKLNIMTLNRSVAEESHIVNFDIESMDHNYCVNMTNIFVVDHIPGKAYNLDVTQYPHLYNIDVIDDFDDRIDLLIGQDYADCFQPLELLKGNKNEPYAVRTPLGYVVYGPNSQHVASNCVVSNLVSNLVSCVVSNLVSHTPERCEQVMGVRSI